MRIAVVDHSFHITTGSSRFLHALLGRLGQVEIFWCDRWNGGPGVDLERIADGRFESVVFWQQLYEPEELDRLARTVRVVLMPMFDQYAGWRPADWRPYRPWPFVSFSLELHRRLRRAGCRSLSVRYFPEAPATGCADLVHGGSGGLSGVFWQRERRIDWPLVARVIGRLPISRLYVRTLPDPGQHTASIPAADRERFGVVDLPWFDRSDEYLAFLGQVDFFVAPRKYEGIGLSFLEALARGKTVIAADRPTMNEYIRHGRNGFLFNIRRPRPLQTLGPPGPRAREIAHWNAVFAADWARGANVILDLVRSGAVAATDGPTPLPQRGLLDSLGRFFRG